MPSFGQAGALQRGGTWPQGALTSSGLRCLSARASCCGRRWCLHPVGLPPGPERLAPAGLSAATVLPCQAGHALAACMTKPKPSMLKSGGSAPSCKHLFPDSCSTAAATLLPEHGVPPPTFPETVGAQPSVLTASETAATLTAVEEPGVVGQLKIATRADVPPQQAPGAMPGVLTLHLLLTTCLPPRRGHSQWWGVSHTSGLRPVIESPGVPRSASLLHGFFEDRWCAVRHCRVACCRLLAGEHNWWAIACSLIDLAPAQHTLAAAGVLPHSTSVFQ